MRGPPGPELFIIFINGLKKSSGKASSSTKPSVNLARRFKDSFSRKGVRVHFIGAWCIHYVVCAVFHVNKTMLPRDTVSSIGIVRGPNLPGMVKLDHTCCFCHALALDERRVKFLPAYACGGVMIDGESK
jgi:hypothetical protein